jgi:hypothetical protein
MVYGGDAACEGGGVTKGIATRGRFKSSNVIPFTILVMPITGGSPFFTISY